MPTRLTREDRLVRLVEKTRARVDAVPKSSRSLRHMPNSKLGVLVREAGYERSSDRLLEELGARLRNTGVGFSPELTDPANTPETRIYFYDSRKLSKGIRATRELFKDEKDLSRFLWLNRDVLTYAKRNNLRILSRETKIANGAIIDLLGVDTKTNELVGFELKAEQGDDRLVGQAAKYMRALKAQAESNGHPGARLLIVTGQPDDDLAELLQTQAQKFGVRTDWLLYRVQFELSEV